MVNECKAELSNLQYKQQGQPLFDFATPSSIITSNFLNHKRKKSYDTYDDFSVEYLLKSRDLIKFTLKKCLTTLC